MVRLLTTVSWVYASFNLLAVVAFSSAGMAVATVFLPGLVSGLSVRPWLTLLLLSQYVLYVLVGLFFMVWLHGFLHQMRDRSLRPDAVDPRWAYLGFATPWVNMVMPYHIVRGLLRDLDADVRSSLQSGIQRVAAVWWMLHITYFVTAPLTLVLLHYHGAIEFTTVTENTEAALVAAVSFCALGVSRFAYKLVLHLECAR